MSERLQERGVYTASRFAQKEGRKIIPNVPSAITLKRAEARAPMLASG
jgi:hypothetical protein